VVQGQQPIPQRDQDKGDDSVANQKTAAKAALVHTCPVCRVSNADLKTFKQHFESKHPKSQMVSV
uniref:Small EDRK-rich factor-like N-terminal domain-containing protein n=1 Tax=Oncorhynchus mykiss TaxID=8022 RepID=A0A8C7VVW0_ONCMY